MGQRPGAPARSFAFGRQLPGGLCPERPRSKQQHARARCLTIPPPEAAGEAQCGGPRRGGPPDLAWRMPSAASSGKGGGVALTELNGEASMLSTSLRHRPGTEPHPRASDGVHSGTNNDAKTGERSAGEGGRPCSRLHNATPVAFMKLALLQVQVGQMASVGSDRRYLVTQKSL